MKFNDDENIEIELCPDSKILTVWFITKTLTYSIAAMFFVFMALFFINVMILSSSNEDHNKEYVVEESDVKAENNDDETKKVVHPFMIFVDYWGWSLLLVGFFSIFVQIYFSYLRRTFRYIVTNRRCVFVGGILKRVERSVPFQKITDVQRSQNILERMLGIWNVQIFTPGTASVQNGQAKARAELNFDGLLNSEELYEIINRHTHLSE